MNISFLALTMPLMIGATPGPFEPLGGPPTPAPFLYVKVLPPKGAQTTWYPGTTEAVSMETPTAVGLRPGYPYRFEVSRIPGHADLKLYPSLEVRGTLVPPSQMDVAKHPIPLSITDAEVELASKGRLITKYIVIEAPDKADPVQGDSDQLLEYRFENEREAIKAIEDKGRLLLVVRFGERSFTKEELAASQVAGTILFPEMKTAPVPAAPPMIPYGGIPLFDPILGPKISGEECLYDGGDTKKVIGIGPKQKVTGLDPSDTAIEFSTPTGRKVVPSNRVCICVPRYVALISQEIPLIGIAIQNPEANLQARTVDRFKNLIHPQDAFRVDGMLGIDSRTRPNGIRSTDSVASVNHFLGRPEGIAQINGVKVVANVQELEQISTTDCKMLLVKWCEPKVPQKIGEEVTFFLKYHNATNNTMTDVVVSDSLTARLEFITNSSKSDRGATLIVEPNEAGSVTLKWAIDGKLRPGEGGLIQFKAKIR